MKGTLLFAFVTLQAFGVTAPGSDLSTLKIAGKLALQERPARKPGGGGEQVKPGDQAKPAEAEDFDKAVSGYELKSGVLNAYVKGESLYFEVPKAMLGRDFLAYAEMKATPGGNFSGSEVAEGVFRFEQRGDKLLMRSISYSTRATGASKATKLSVEQSNVQPIAQALDIKAKSKSGGILVDVTRLFKSGIPELAINGALGGGIDSNRTFIEKVNAFPDNVNVEILATGTAAPQLPGAGGRRGGFGSAGSKPSNTGIIHFSFVLLPEKPMMGRLGDSRVGYFSTGFTEFGGNYHGTKDYEFIDRYRLEKKDPKAAMSEPVKQIVYYIGREVPEKWRPWIKKGVEEWNVAFEAAGFKNAITCKEAPNDPNWSEEDVRYSCIRWAPLPIANAVGPHVSDPRSGEILSAHVIIWHDILKLQTEWYYAQAGATDPRVSRLPMPDDLMGECLQFVVAHEVGHTLGFPHNGKSSAMIPTEYLRNKAWTDKNGTCTSIMDYARFNYVAQPGDGISAIPKVGAYDIFATKWGYTPLNASNPMDEKPVLDQWASAQVSNPMLRFYDNFSPSDPTAMSEALGDDAVVASSYGVMNLKRLMANLSNATTKTGEDYSELARFHGALMGQFGLYIGHVSAMIGGVIQTDYHAGRGGDVYNPVAKDRQRAAVKWLGENVLEPPMFLVPDSVIYKYRGTSGLTNINAMHSRAINSMLNDGRLSRMLDNQLRNGKKAYTVQEMMSDIREMVWKELSAKSVTVSPYRRGAQRSLVNALIAKLANPSTDVRAYASTELKIEQSAIEKGAAKSADVETKAHLQDLAMMIDQALKFPPPVSAAPPANAGFFPFIKSNSCDMFGKSLLDPIEGD